MGMMLSGQIAWVTGAGSGIGEAAALALAGAGATVILSARGEPSLERVRGEIEAAGGTAHVEPCDVTDAARVYGVAKAIEARFGRLDIVVNNAGANVRERSWAQLVPEGIDTIVHGNLSSSFYVVAASLPLMRAGGGGILIHTASWAGRYVGPLSGPAYVAAKHAVIAMSHAINVEEYVNGIRSTALCPAEVATPLLEKRPVPVSAEDRARMLQPDDLGQTILFIATRPKHVCINELLISPTWNRFHPTK